MKIKDIVLWIIGFIVTIILPPLILAIITYIVFPRSEYNFVQIFWLIILGWLSLNYITINIEKAIKENINKK